MDKRGVLIFRVGREISERKVNPSDYRMILVQDGQLDISVQKENCCAAPGQIVIIGATKYMAEICPSEDFEGYLLQISDAVSVELLQRYFLYMDAASPLLAVLPAGKQEQSIRAIFRNMETEQHASDGSNEAILELLFQELLVRLYRIAPHARNGGCLNRDGIVSGICDLIEKQYYTPITLEFIAAQCNMSVSYLSHIFKNITGVSIMRYLLLTRVNAAKRYLEQTHLPIGEVADKCGFNDVSNFGRTFRKEIGCSPRQYRNKWRNARISDK